ncbi:MAG TPA: M50 family metallopeptidase [Solirubrobacteraceae bacterium]|nr:M50 family metallopeptidase [Solirubrobacteraceae bacterium]
MLGRSRSVRLFTVSGIRVGVDASWFIILFLMIYLLSGPFRATLHSSDTVAYLTTVISVLALFASIIVHELGHAAAARHRGVGVERIDLYLFGGLTLMDREPETPSEDFTIAVAGPLATAVMIVVFIAADFALVGSHRLLDAIELQSNIHITPALLALSWLIPVNVLLLAFNLLPAFPLDGGRIVRAAVWRVTGERRRGTIAAARLGQVLALALGGFGLYLLIGAGSFSGLYMAGLGWILYSEARAAIARSALEERVDGIRVQDIMDSEPVTIPAELPASQALEEYFLRYRWPWFAVVEADGRFAGIAAEADLRRAIDAGEGWVRVGSLVGDGSLTAGRVGVDSPITALIGSEPLGRLGALMAVDSEGMLRGVVTVEQLRRALSAAFGR